MWNLSNIPKVLHLYWGRNKPLSYLRYLTVRSFISLNPDWKVKVYYPKEISYVEDWETGNQERIDLGGEDYFFQLIEEQGEQLQVKEFDLVPTQIPEVIKSDIIRLYLLGREGGVWSDFDILYIRPMSEINCDDSNINTFVCKQLNSRAMKHYYSIGFLIGGKGNKLYNKLYSDARIILQDTTNIDYQRIGTKLFKQNEAYIKSQNEIGYIIPQTVYPVAYNETRNLFHEVIDCSHSIGVHWYGGSKDASLMEYQLSNDIERVKDCTMKRLVMEMEACI